MKPEAVCRICTHEVVYFSNADILKKYRIDYFKCGYCGFVQTENPFWLKEAYSNPIVECDIGPVNRAVVNSKITRALILCLLKAHANFVDYGAGYGLFVRMMRDHGFNFKYHDKYCENIFAKKFEIELAGRFELVTAFEVFEHLENPVETLNGMLNISDNIFISTELIPSDCPKPTEWWYYALDGGQHISFFTSRALSILAERFNLRLYSDGFYHFFCKSKIPVALYRIIVSDRMPGVALNALAKYRRVSSLLQNDFQNLLKAR